MNHHRINYIEFPAQDLTRIKEFYTAVFGWQFTDYGPEYVGFNDGNLDGGFTAGVVASASGPLVILYSENLEESLRAVESAGGSITLAPFDFPGGRRFHFADPAGNQLAVWSEQASPAPA
jgi:predicted enzyme related to lactoylglutathione lyase